MAGVEEQESKATVEYVGLRQGGHDVSISKRCAQENRAGDTVGGMEVQQCKQMSVEVDADGFIF